MRMFGMSRRSRERETEIAQAQAVAHQLVRAALAQSTKPSHAPPVDLSHMIADRRARAYAYLAEVQKGRGAAVDTPESKIAAAREFVRKSTIGSAALRVWSIAIQYQAWCKCEDGSGWKEIDISKATEQSDLLVCSTGFRCGDHSWVLMLEKRGSSHWGDNDLGRFRVFVDAELVMELAVAKGLKKLDEWVPGDVRALKIGPWAGTLIEVWAALEFAEQRTREEAEAARHGAASSRILLG
jgi:hypothetical protein